MLFFLFYDAMQITYKTKHEAKRPESLAHSRLFEVLAAVISFDSDDGGDEGENQSNEHGYGTQQLQQCRTLA